MSLLYIFIYILALVLVGGIGHFIGASRMCREITGSYPNGETRFLRWVWAAAVYAATGKLKIKHKKDN